MEGGRRRKLVLAAALALVAFGAMAPLARADDSQIKISEVYSDASVAKGDFIELQLMAADQQIAAGRVIRLYNATGSATISFIFPASTLPASESQRTVLIGWDTNPNADFQISAGFNPPAPGGAACFLQANAFPGVPIDCVTWGTFSGTLPTFTGQNAPALNASQSLNRTKARGCATALDGPDDSDNSAADFSLAGPTPRNNLALPDGTECALPPRTASTVTTPAHCKKTKKKHSRSAAAAKKKKGCKKKVKR
jgi:hypothetical protein